MNSLAVRAWMKIVAMVVLSLMAVWVFTARSDGTLPARPVSNEENDADAPRPDHPGEAILYRRLSLQDEHGNIPLDGLARGVAHAHAMTEAAKAPNGGGIGRTRWTWIGPGNVGGRIRAIMISPTQASTLWIGSVSGGIWKSTDSGATWQVVDDFMANLAISSLIMDPTNSSIMYAGTGEGFYNADGIRGAGVFKSIDGGTTWAQLASTANDNWIYVNRLTFSPNGATLLAATRSGTWRSTNGGSIWTRVHVTETLDVNFDPTDSLKAIAGGRGGQAWYSSDGGVSWNAATGLPKVSSPWYGGRVEVAYAPSNPAIVYASVDNSSGQIYQSVDGGGSYTLVNTGNNYLGGQGWYDNIVWVDPTNANLVVVGGIDLWRSTNSGSTLTKISQWYSAPTSAHADHHAIVEDPGFDGTSNRIVYFGNDGGIYRAANVYTVANLSGWQELNNNLGITQFYGAAGNPTTGVIIGGTQDNGTLRYSGNTEGWTDMYGGDGGFNASDPTDPNYFYGEYVYLQIHRSTNGGASSSDISSGISEAGSSTCANFIAPFILDPNNPNTMLAGGCQLWRSNNIKAATPSWSGIKPSLSQKISAIAVASGNSNIIWVGHNNGDVYSTTNGTLATPTWNQADLGTPGLPNRQVLRITIDPIDAQKTYVTFGGFNGDNVWRTTNGGATWTDITGSGLTGLPNVPVRSLVIHPANTHWLYVGTEVGIFASEDGGATWSVPHDGPANVSVDELFWLNNRTLIAATHGRGLYKTIFDTPVVQLSAANYSVNEGTGGMTITAKLTATATTTVTVNYATNNGTAVAPGDYVTASGTLTFTPGVTLTTFNVTVVDDALVENAEVFTVTLNNPVGATLGAPAAAPVTIIDNDLPVVQFSAATYTSSENVGTSFITVMLNQPAPATVTVHYVTGGGTATAGLDYTPVSGTLTITAGLTVAEFGLPIINDAQFEPLETLGLTLSAPTNAALGAVMQTTLTINDNDFGLFLPLVIKQ